MKLAACARVAPANFMINAGEGGAGRMGQQPITQWFGAVCFKVLV